MVSAFALILSIVVLAFALMAFCEADRALADATRLTYQLSELNAEIRRLEGQIDGNHQ